MKLTARQIDAFVKKPDPAARAILVYGPDEGLVRERAALIGKGVVADLNDPFNVAALTGDQLSADPARLRDEALALSMMGGARLIRIEGAGDALTVLLKDYLKDPSRENLLVIEAGELGTRSSLRKLFEGAPNAAALPCYTASAGDAQTLVRQELSAAGLQADSDALAWLGQRLTGDRALARGEIEKLIVYMGTTPGARLTLADAQACCGQDGDRSLDDLVYAAAGSNPETALRSFRQLVDEGTPIIVIHRSLQNHFRRLHFVRSQMENGVSMTDAINGLNPKIFFKWEDPFRAQVGRWGRDALGGILNRLAQLEAECKKTGAPDETLTAQAILSLAARR